MSKKYGLSMLVLGGLLTLPAMAQVPPGHPSPAQSREMLLPEKAPRPSELPNQGKVLSAVHANEFTYIEVVLAGSKAVEWIAVQKMEVKPGSAIRYEDGAVMKDFYSKLLKRTFASVRFVDYVSVTAAP
ncbi:MAG: hypothetical protein D3M94_17495 [Rhodocyclales bacterium GT-UBC]|nr:MAG: hypothetical protein D3M94_17495 [Rhodocyclales bacterium GT-UBC]